MLLGGPAAPPTHAHTGSAVQPEQARRLLYQRVIGSMPNSDSFLAEVSCDVGFDEQLASCMNVCGKRFEWRNLLKKKSNVCFC